MHCKKILIKKYMEKVLKRRFKLKMEGECCYHSSIQDLLGRQTMQYTSSMCFHQCNFFNKSSYLLRYRNNVDTHK